MPVIINASLLYKIIAHMQEQELSENVDQMFQLLITMYA